MKPRPDFIRPFIDRTGFPRQAQQILQRIQRIERAPVVINRLTQPEPKRRTLKTAVTPAAAPVAATLSGTLHRLSASLSGLGGGGRIGAIATSLHPLTAAMSGTAAGGGGGGGSPVSITVTRHTGNGPLAAAVGSMILVHSIGPLTGSGIALSLIASSGGTMLTRPGPSPITETYSDYWYVGTVTSSPFSLSGDVFGEWALVTSSGTLSHIGTDHTTTNVSTSPTGFGLWYIPSKDLSFSLLPDHSLQKVIALHGYGASSLDSVAQNEFVYDTLIDYSGSGWAWSVLPGSAAKYPSAYNTSGVPTSDPTWRATGAPGNPDNRFIYETTGEISIGAAQFEAIA